MSLEKTSATYSKNEAGTARPFETPTLNGLVTSHGLIVSSAYWMNGKFVVDVFRDDLKSVTPMLVSDVQVEHPEPCDPNALLPGHRRKVSGWKLQATIQNAFFVLAARPALGEEADGKLIWTTWKTLDQRSTNLARFLRSILPASSCVCLCARNSIDWFIALLGVVLADLIAVPVHCLSQDSFRSAVVAEADVHAAFVDKPGDWKSLRVLDMNRMSEMEAQGAALRKHDAEQADTLEDCKTALRRLLGQEPSTNSVSPSAVQRHIRAFVSADKWDDELGQLVAMLAREEDTQWLSILESPGEIGPLTMCELADSWLVASDRTRWEAVGQRFGEVWLTAVLESLTRQPNSSPELVGYALSLAEQQKILDPWTVDLVCRFAACVPYTEQQPWYELADKVAPAKVGSWYEVLHTLPLRRDIDGGEQFFELAESSVVEVLQVSGSSVKVACDIAQGWLDLWNSDGVPNIDETVPDPMVMILYTSGSTGTPKGALIRNSAMNSYVCRGGAFVSDFSGVHIQGSPLSTSAAPYNILVNILAGGRTVILQEGGQTFEVAPLVGPTMLGGVPQMWMLLYKRFQDQLQLCRNEIEIQALHLEAGSWLGPRIQHVNCGGALPCPAVMSWLKSTLINVEVTENYGITEAGGITGGATGQLQPIKEGTKVRLEDFGVYRTTDVPPRGEICVKTNRMAAGYLNRPDLTSEAFTADGFFRTGDIGEMPNLDHLRVIDRKKAFFKLSNGEWVSPETVEVIFSEVPEVRQVLVYGDSEHDHIVAIAVSESPPTRVLEAFRIIMRARKDVRHFEIPKAVHVTSERWDVQNGLLTSTGKICRRKIVAKYQSAFREMLEAEYQNEQSENEVVRLIRQGTDEKAWQDLDLTSITAVRATHAIRIAFGVDVPVVHLLRKAALGLIKAHVEGKHKLTLSSNPQILTLGDFVPQAGHRASTVFMTGATGHVGACVLQLLTQSSELPVTALVRGPSNAAARKRLHEVLSRRGYMEAAAHVQAEKVRVVAGDLREENLGLPRPDFFALSGGVMLHIAAEVNHLQGYEALQAANVSGVRTLLNLATLQPTKLVFVSTMSAKGSRNLSGYGQSKRAAEELVYEALLRGMHGSILQFGMVGPDRITGASNVQDWLIRYVLGAVQVGAWHGIGSLRLYPCEEVAKAIIARIDDDTSLPEGCILPCSVLMNCVAASEVTCGRRIRQVSLAEWQELLDDLPESNPMFPLRHYYYSSGLGHDVAEHGPCGYNQDSVSRMMRFLDQQGLIPRFLMQRTMSNSKTHEKQAPFALLRSISQGSANAGSLRRNISKGASPSCKLNRSISQGFAQEDIGHGLKPSISQRGN